MDATLTAIGSERVLVLQQEGAFLDTDDGRAELIGEAFSQQATLIAAPVARFRPAFFSLKTRLFGELAQKLVNYRIKLAILGDISPFLDESESLQAFVREAHRGTDLCFVPDLEALRARLTP